MDRGHVLSGMFTLIITLFLGAVFAYDPIRVLSSGASFLHSVVAITLNPKLFGALWNGELLELWVGALVILLGPIIGFWLSWRGMGDRAQRREHNGDELGQWDLASREFRKRRIALSGLLVVLLLYLITLVCPFVAPHHPNAFSEGTVTQFRPPFSRIQALVFREARVRPPEHSVDLSDVLAPSIVRTALSLNRSILHDRFDHLMFVEGYHIEASEVVATIGREAVRIPIAHLVSSIPEEFVAEVSFPLGTDTYGRDLLSRIMYGSRISLTLGIIAVILSVTLGTFVGLLAGYFGRWIDGAFMRLVDVLLALPSLFFILVIIAIFDAVAVPRIVLVIGVLSITSWMGVARLVRGEVLSLKEREFVVAARALGINHISILFRHILPNTLSPVIVNATLRIGGIILVEAALSYLNLGVQQPTASWGNIIFEGKDVLSSAWWISTFPGFAIVVTVVSFNLVGDGLRDAFDPLVSAKE